jgi:hypothetical protein
MINGKLKDLSQSRPLLMPCQVLLLQRIFGVMSSKLGHNNAINNYLAEMFCSSFPLFENKCTSFTNG